MASPFKLELTEAQFQGQLTEVAAYHGWHWLHIEKALNERGYWRTPIRGPLGKGWPDLVLIKGSRVLFVELKANGKQPTADQRQVLEILSHIPGAEVYVWHPDQFEEIMGRLTQ
jgi:hypothetical protein